MGWSSRHFLLSPDDVLHRLADSAFSRMLLAGSGVRLPDFMGQRVRMASVTIATAGHKHGSIALGVRHISCAMLDFDESDALDVQRLNAQQVARLDAMVAGIDIGINTGMSSGMAANDVQRSGLVEAGSRFVARGGIWQPSPPLRRRLEAAAMGALACRRVRVILDPTHAQRR